MARTYRTEAVVLRSFRLGEADRVLHVYTADRGRVGAVAKGVRRTKSRFGGRLEPLSHVELMLHQGSGELQTVTGADLRSSHHEAREDPYRLAVGLIGAEAMLKLFTEQEANERAFTALTRFLDQLDTLPSRAPARPALDPLVLSFQLKLLWLSGYMPHLDGCVECGTPRRARRLRPCRRRRRLPRLRRRIDRALTGRTAWDLDARRDPDGRCGRGGAHRPRRPRGAGARDRELRAPRRLPAAHAVGVKKQLKDGYELDDDSARDRP